MFTSARHEKAQLRALSGNRRKIKHHVLDAFGQWKPSNVMPHGKIDINLRVSQSAVQQLSLPVLNNAKHTQVSALADTDAQMCVADWNIAKRLGLEKQDLFAPALSVSVADNSSLELIGAHFLVLYNNSGVSTEQLVYFADGVGEFYLSQHALKELKVIPSNFPTIGSCENARAVVSSGPATSGRINEVHGEFSPELRQAHPAVDRENHQSQNTVTPPSRDNSQSFHLGSGPVSQPTTAASHQSRVSTPLPPPQVSKLDHKGRELAACGCLKRTAPPPVPTTLPFNINPSNVSDVQQWFLDTYASSSFNVCTQQLLPLMTGLPPLRIHIKDDAMPVAIHKPSTIPVHWAEQVKAELEQDIQLGVLERVPSNTPSTWCSRMHVVGKKLGNPRRVVDLREVNAATSRQTHSTEPPFKQAMSVPPNTWRYTTDAWNGYHSIPLDEKDRHITTFLTPWGRMRCQQTSSLHIVGSSQTLRRQRRPLR